MKKTIIAWFISIACILSAVESFKLYRDEAKERARLLLSVSESYQKTTYYKTKAGQEAAKSFVLTLQLKEARAMYPAILGEIENLKVKPSRAQTFTETVISNEKRITTILKDSIIYDTIRVRAFNYSDKWYKVQGNINQDTINLQIQSADTIVQVVYKGERRKPWAWIFSRRQLQQSITSKNPANKIHYSRVLQITK